MQRSALHQPRSAQVDGPKMQPSLSRTGHKTKKKEQRAIYAWKLVDLTKTKREFFVSGVLCFAGMQVIYHSKIPLYQSLEQHDVPRGIAAANTKPMNGT